jgi:hypothetical protein
MYPGEVVWVVMNWVSLAQNRDQWWALLKTVLKLCVTNKAGHFLTS